jgi:DNA repair photolyase
MKIETASKSALLQKSLFKGYDACLNPYVGCQFGCKYCYVRFFVKDSEKDWGEFVRIRDHIKTKLPKEVSKGYLRISAGKVKDAEGNTKKLHRTIYNPELRIVVGTMTDPYMPIERRHRITREALKILSKGLYKKIGIFTRSPIVTDDIDIIKTLPRARVHYSITPYERPIMKKLEPIPVLTERRFETITALKKEGIFVNVNVAPCIPVYSEALVDEFAYLLAESAPDEFFVDPMQAYDQGFKATKDSLQDDPNWAQVEATMQDKAAYQTWKVQYREKWRTAWEKHGNKTTLPIWCDHISHVWENLATGEPLNPRSYND